MELKQTYITAMNNLKIKHKLIVLYCFTFFLPLLFVSILFISRLYNTLLGWERQQADASFQRTESIFGDILSSVSELSDRLYVNKPVQDIIQIKYTNPRDIYNAYASISFIDDFLRAYESVASIRFYTDNQKLLDNSFIEKTTPDVLSEQWYIQAISLKGQPFWTYKRDTITGKMYLSLVRSVWRTMDKTFIGVLSINLNPYYINKTLDTQIFDTFVVYDGTVIYSTKRMTDKNSINKILSAASSESGSAVSINGKKSEALTGIFHPAHGASDKFNIVCMIPMDKLTETTKHVTKLVVLIMLFFLFLSAIMLLVFSHYFGNRVRRVRSGILRVVSNNFEIEKSIGGKDEFAEIYDALYEMSVNIKKLIKEVYIKDLEKEQLISRQNDIRFKMLSTQINPHFLFNTLEHIRMKAVTSGDKDVPYMLKMLAKILRYNLSVTGECVPLFSEIEIINDYLEIQHKRFADRISYDIMPLCDVRNIQILPLLIQPIVENSFTHGLESRTAGGFIYIEIKEKTEYGKRLLIITIRDNGCGIPVDKLNEITVKLQNDTVEHMGSSIGMVNVNQRIKLYYGNEYGIKIQSTEGQGTSVSLKLPFIEKQKSAEGTSSLC